MIKKQHDCSEIVQKVELMLDGELNKREEQDVMCELQRCMHCLEEYNLQKRFKDFICNRVAKKIIPESCLEKIKQSINKLD